MQVGALVEGTAFPEPVRALLLEKIGHSVKIGGEGLRSRRYRQILLDNNKLAAPGLPLAEQIACANTSEDES